MLIKLKKTYKVSVDQEQRKDATKHETFLALKALASHLYKAHTTLQAL